MSSVSRGNSSQACAACKYQRRKCAPDCILAPYFPHDRQHQFLNAHKLFGFSNITKLIRHLPPPDKDQAMRTIIFQSDVRASDPVGGCYRIIRDLQRQIEFAKAELDVVLHHLAICRAQANQAAQSHRPEHNNHLVGNLDPNQNQATGYPNVDPTASLVRGVDIVNAEPFCSYINPASNYNHDIVSLQDVTNSWTMQNYTPPSSSSPSSFQVKQSSTNGGICDVAANDEKPALPEFKPPEATINPSDESGILEDDKGELQTGRESFQNDGDHDLKGAATFFTLTNEY